MVRERGTLGGMVKSMKRYALLAVAAVAFAAACGGEGNEPFVTAEGAPESTAELAEQLRGRGFDVEETGEVSCPLFSGRGHELIVDGHAVETLDYTDLDSLETDVGRVSPDGTKIGTDVGGRQVVTDIAFKQPPHYFRSNGMIVLYVGSETALLAALVDVFGPQFAGQ